MSWEQLDLEISEMFDEYAWRADDITMALEIRAARMEAGRSDYEKTPERRASVRAASRQWKANNRERALGYLKQYRSEIKLDADRLAKQREYHRNYQRQRRGSVVTGRACRGCGGTGHNARTCEQMKRAA